jgi:hypothetical protein
VKSEAVLCTLKEIDEAYRDVLINDEIYDSNDNNGMQRLGDKTMTYGRCIESALSFWVPFSFIGKYEGFDSLLLCCNGVCTFTSFSKTFKKSKKRKSRTESEDTNEPASKRQRTAVTETSPRR